MRSLILLLPLLVSPALAEEKERPAFEPPALDAVIKLYDAKTGERLALDTLLDRLATHEVVFFGETHLDETTHRLELAVLEGLIEKTGGKIVLAMEMFERDVQPALDDYLAGKIGETEFVHKARAWGNYRSGYRALVETAKRHGLPVVASNAPTSLRRKLAFGGPETLAKLPPEERRLLPEKLLPNTDAYWERVARVVRGHFHMVTGGSPERRLTSSQSLWDNCMGDSCVRALAKHPGHLVLHLNGGFHSQYREGTVTQLMLRRPETKAAVLEAVTVTDLPGVAEWKHPERADFLAAVDDRARGPQEGFHAVRVAPELRYRIRVPQGATKEKPAPLLVWLGDDEFRAADGLRTWRTALGDEAAVVAVEPFFPQVTDDLSLGGRWNWPETFRQDIGMMMDGLSGIVGYVHRHFPVDGARVVIAGQGTGATVVAAASLYAGGLDFPLLAVAPRRHTGLHGMALPEPAEPKHKLTVLTGDRAWWEREAKDHAKVSRTTDVVDAPDSAWELFVATENRIRAALDLEPRPAAEGAATVLVLQVDTPRARMWAHRMARRLEAQGQRAAVATGAADGVPLACLGEGKKHTFGPDTLKSGRGIPMAAGAFGGTTVLYVPAGRTEAQRAAWEELETEDVLHKLSRFARLKVVFEGDAKDNLRAALQDVKDKGRTTVLVVPAVFCASGKDMRRWAAEAKEFEDVLNISWRPGLGGSLQLPAHE